LEKKQEKNSFGEHLLARSNDKDYSSIVAQGLGQIG
jgi:hypothetical protein